MGNSYSSNSFIQEGAEPSIGMIRNNLEPKEEDGLSLGMIRNKNLEPDSRIEDNGNRIINLYNYSKAEYKKIMNFSDVKKGNIYVNLIHYDKNLKKKENFEYYRYFSIKIIGNYSPFDDPEMLKLYISKTNELTQPPHYILMISGMESTEILKEFHEIGFIDDVIIFCFEPNKYVDLKTNYSKVKLISNNFYDVIDFLLSKRHSDRDLNIDSHLLLTPLITYFIIKKDYFQFIEFYPIFLMTLIFFLIIKLRQ